jgi:hypothetical protein
MDFQLNRNSFLYRLNKSTRLLVHDEWKIKANERKVKGSEGKVKSTSKNVRPESETLGPTSETLRPESEKQGHGMKEHGKRVKN